MNFAERMENVPLKFIREWLFHISPFPLFLSYIYTLSLFLPHSFTIPVILTFSSLALAADY